MTHEHASDARLRVRLEATKAAAATRTQKLRGLNANFKFKFKFRVKKHGPIVLMRGHWCRCHGHGQVKVSDDARDGARNCVRGVANELRQQGIQLEVMRHRE